MSDLVRRQDVIRSLQSMMRDCFPEAEEELDAVVTTVREIPSAEPEWTPVSERLPEEDVDVLLQFPNSMAVGYIEDDWWSICTYDDMYSGLDEADAKPIAWMPLPEPWRGE